MCMCIYRYYGVWSFIYTHHIRFLKIPPKSMKNTYHFIGIHRHRHPSVKKLQPKHIVVFHIRYISFSKFIFMVFPWFQGEFLKKRHHLPTPHELLRSFPWSFISGPWLTKKSMQVLISVLQLAPAASTASAQTSTWKEVTRSSNDSKATGDGTLWLCQNSY